MNTDNAIRDEFVRRLSDVLSTRSPSTAMRHRLAAARHAAQERLTEADYDAAVFSAHAIA
jgi:hypothetical protein